MMWGEHDKAGKRKLPKQRCLEMDWNDKQEISAWEIAYCIQEYHLPTTKVPSNRLDAVEKHSRSIFRTKLINEKNKRIETIKEHLHDICPTLYLDGCKEFKQLVIVEDLLKPSNITEWYSEVKSKFNPRDTKHYNDDKAAYFEYLNKAKSLLTKYDSDKNEPGIKIDELIELGFPEPMTQKEFRDKILIHNIILQLEGVGLSKTAAKKLSKQISDYHFPR